MIALTSTVKIDAEPGNLTVYDGKTIVQVTEFPSSEPSV